MKGLTTVYALAPRVLALVAVTAAFVVGSVLSKPELLMRTALTEPLPAGQVHYDEVVDQRDLVVSKLIADDSALSSMSAPRLMPAGLYGHVSPGDQIPVTLAANKLGLIEVTDIRELGKLIVPASGQQEPKDYLLLTGRIVGDSDGELVRLIVDANARPPFQAYQGYDRRSL